MFSHRLAFCQNSAALSCWLHVAIQDISQWLFFSNATPNSRDCCIRRRWETRLPSQQLICTNYVSVLLKSHLFQETYSKQNTRKQNIEQVSLERDHVSVTKIYIQVILCQKHIWEEGHEITRFYQRITYRVLHRPSSTYLKNKHSSPLAHSKASSRSLNKTASGFFNFLFFSFSSFLFNTISPTSSDTDWWYQ